MWFVRVCALLKGNPDHQGDDSSRGFPCLALCLACLPSSHPVHTHTELQATSVLALLAFSPACPVLSSLHTCALNPNHCLEGPCSWLPLVTGLACSEQVSCLSLDLLQHRLHIHVCSERRLHKGRSMRALSLQPGSQWARR